MLCLWFHSSSPDNPIAILLYHYISQATVVVVVVASSSSLSYISLLFFNERRRSIHGQLYNSDHGSSLEHYGLGYFLG